ncbi:Ankyrin repeat domain-containing protein 50 [Geodia barretti]|uniref:Ankyrin repeat domain-containing protein 50 n=1 Tax=Geodia barretti TaxID=519541 RepID=A0AA35T545_GEOBA|nr:Ankyrin repeat domain-containing protein 50 [Geodia barretti]
MTYTYTLSIMMVSFVTQEGSTALLAAGWKGHSEVVKLLLGAGARDIPNKDGNTALSMARANNHNDVVQYLLQHQPK